MIAVQQVRDAKRAALREKREENARKAAAEAEARGDMAPRTKLKRARISLHRRSSDVGEAESPISLSESASPELLPEELVDPLAVRYAPS